MSHAWALSSGARGVLETRCCVALKVEVAAADAVRGGAAATRAWRAVVHPVTCSTREDHQRRNSCFKIMLDMLGKRLVHLSRRNAAGRQVHVRRDLQKKNDLHM